MPGGRRAFDVSASSTSVHVPAIPVVYLDAVSPVSLESVPRDYDEYHGMPSGPGEASLKAATNDVCLEELLGRSCYGVRVQAWMM